jgi:predicted nucleic acid-binding protein
LARAAASPAPGACFVILVDTSVWVDHFRRGNARLVRLLEEGTVVCHSFVLGELTLGNLARDREVSGLLAELPSAPAIDHDEAMQFVARHRLAGSGVGWVDVHLLGSAALGDFQLWTLDRKLGRVAERLGLAA